jgi:hypothetical protein
MSSTPARSLHDLTREIIDKIPPSLRFNAQDAERVLALGPVLRALEDDLVRGFYDTIQSHPPMAAILAGAERSAREMTLRRWWQRTLAGPFDDKYWAWQSLIGMVHIKVGVKNPMMMGMWGWIVAWLQQQMRAGALGNVEQGLAVLDSFGRLVMTAQALTAESYLSNYLETLIRTTGFKPALLERMAANEISRMIAEARSELGAV